MPSGRTHDRITLWSLPIVASTTLVLTQQSSVTLIVAAGYLFGGLMLGPDLDIHSIHYKRWGWLRWIWLPYRGSMRHRSPWSHAPVTGTIVRVLYLLAWLLGGGLMIVTIVNEIAQLGWTWGDIAQSLQAFWQRYQPEAIAFVVGLELGAFSHYMADWGVSSLKRQKKRRSRSGKPTAKRRK